MPDSPSDGMLTGDDLTSVKQRGGRNGLSVGKAVRALVFMAGFLGLLWVIQLANWADSYRLDMSFGIVPRSDGHLADIFTAPSCTSPGSISKGTPSRCSSSVSWPPTGASPSSSPSR